MTKPTKRRPTMRPNTVQLYYGKTPEEHGPKDAPELCIQWGPGATKRHGAALLYQLLGVKTGAELKREFEHLGLDLTTLRISIETSPRPEEAP